MRRSRFADVLPKTEVPPKSMR